MKKGFTLIEMMVAIIISIVALFGIETLIIESFKDWKAGQDIVDLERDLDLASYKIKWVLEEANADTIYTVYGGTETDTGTDIRAGYNTEWWKEFYRTSGNALVYQNDATGESETIIKTLTALSFQKAFDNHSVRVNLTVVKKSKPQDRRLDSSFLVYLRNKGKS